MDNEKQYAYEHKILSHMQQECVVFISDANKNTEKQLCEDDIRKYIENMKTIWNTLPNSEKPTWISLSDIDEYQNKMLSIIKNARR